MKQELYQYSISLKERTDKVKRTPVVHVCTFFLIGLFALLTIFIINIWVSVFILLSYTLFFIYNRKEKDQYAKLLFDIGLFVFYLSLETSVVFNNIPSFLGLFGIIFPLCLLTYEIKVYIGIKQKKYSFKNKNNNKEKFAAIMGSLTVACGLIGLRLGRSISQNYRDSTWFVGIVIVVASLLFVVSISYLQKYIIYKIITRHSDEL